MEWLIAIILVFIFFMWCFCKVSSECSKEEEKYRTLDTKELDNEQKWEDSLVYDDEFIKREVKDEQNKN